MKVAVLGAGAVGGYFGAKLARAGVPVHFIARGAHLQAIRRHGLQVRTAGESFTVTAPATDDPAAVGPVELVLFCVKSYQTEQAAPFCRPLLGPDTAVLVLQNGVDNEEKVARVVGSQRVLSGVAYVGVEVSTPGVVEHFDRGELLVGELDGHLSERVQRVAQLFQRAGVPCQAVEDIMVRKWQKFLFNCALNALTALSGCRLPEILSAPRGQELFRRTVEEAAQVARAHGVPLAQDAVDGVMATARRMNIGSSMLSDLRKGRPLELEAFNGLVVRLGQRYGIPTPVNETLYALLTVVASSRQSAGAAPSEP